MIRDDADMTSRPREFAAAKAQARRRHLQSLDDETAAAELEAVLHAAYELRRAAERAGLPPPPENPLPGPTLAILLAGAPSPEDE